MPTDVASLQAELLACRAKNETTERELEDALSELKETKKQKQSLTTEVAEKNEALAALMAQMGFGMGEGDEGDMMYGEMEGDAEEDLE